MRIVLCLLHWSRNNDSPSRSIYRRHGLCNRNHSDRLSHVLVRDEMRTRDMLLIGALMLLGIVGGDAILRVFWTDHAEWLNQVMFASGLVAGMYVVTWLVAEIIERQQK